MRKIVTSLTALLLVCFFITPAFAKPWKIAHIRPADSEIQRDLTWYATEIREQTDNRIDIQIFGNSQLGDYTTVQERVGIGSVEMSCESVATQVDKRLLIGTLQYVVSDYKEARENFGMGGPLANYMTDLYAKQDIKVLAWWPMYFGGIGLTKEPKEPTNPHVAKNLKVRVPTMKTFEVLANNLGYLATPLPFAEFFTAAQTGIVDGIFGGGAENYYSSFRDIIKYYIPANTHFEIWPLLINAELYAGLSDADKKILDTVSAEFENKRWVKAEEDQAHYEKQLADAGIVVYSMTPEEIAAFAKVARETVFPEFEKIIGKKAFKEITDLMQK